MEEKCKRCDGDGKAHGSDRPFESSGTGDYPGKCHVCMGSGKAMENHERREAITRRLCQSMGWEYKTGPVWGGLRKVAMAEAVVVGLDKLEEIAARLEKCRCKD